MLLRKSCESQPESSQTSQVSELLSKALLSTKQSQRVLIFASDYPFNTTIFPMDCNEVSKKPLELAQGCRKSAKSWGSLRAKAMLCLLARVSTALLSLTSCLLHIHHTGRISFSPFSAQEKILCCFTAVTLLPGHICHCLQQEPGQRAHPWRLFHSLCLKSISLHRYSLF